MTYTGSLKWYTLAKGILDAVIAGTTSVFPRAAVVPGLIAWDGCDCGALYLMVNQTYASDSFPMQKIGPDLSEGCGALFEGGQFVLQVMQCAPSGTSLSPPTTADQEAAARLVRRDAFEVYRAVNGFLCTARNARDIEDFVMDEQIVQGPSGGCVGTELRFRVGLTWE